LEALPGQVAQMSPKFVHHVVNPMRSAAARGGSERFRTLLRDQAQKAIHASEDAARSLLTNLNQIAQGTVEPKPERKDVKQT
jgi:hypothetical protein